MVPSLCPMSTSQPTMAPPAHARPRTSMAGSFLHDEVECHFGSTIAANPFQAASARAGMQPASPASLAHMVVAVQRLAPASGGLQFSRPEIAVGGSSGGVCSTAICSPIQKVRPSTAAAAAAANPGSTAVPVLTPNGGTRFWEWTKCVGNCPIQLGGPSQVLSLAQEMASRQRPGKGGPGRPVSLWGPGSE